MLENRKIIIWIVKLNKFNLEWAKIVVIAVAIIKVEFRKMFFFFRISIKIKGVTKTKQVVKAFLFEYTALIIFILLNE